MSFNKLSTLRLGKIVAVFFFFYWISKSQALNRVSRPSYVSQANKGWEIDVRICVCVCLFLILISWLWLNLFVQRYFFFGVNVIACYCCVVQTSSDDIMPTSTRKHIYCIMWNEKKISTKNEMAKRKYFSWCAHAPMQAHWYYNGFHTRFISSSIFCCCSCSRTKFTFSSILSTPFEVHFIAYTLSTFKDNKIRFQTKKLHTHAHQWNSKLNWHCWGCFSFSFLFRFESIN